MLEKRDKPINMFFFKNTQIFKWVKGLINGVYSLNCHDHFYFEMVNIINVDIKYF